MTPRHVRVSALLILLFAAGAGLDAQVRPSHDDALLEFVVAPAGFVATAAPEPLFAVQDDLSPALAGALASFEEEHGASWSFWVDRRSGSVALAEGAGVPWVSGVGNDLEPLSADDTESVVLARSWEFLDRFGGLFGVPVTQLRLDERGTKQFGENGQFRQVAFRQEVSGVPVAYSRIVLRLSHGNLVQFGATHVAPAGLIPSQTVPTLSPTQAQAALGLAVGGLLPTDEFIGEPELTWILRGAGDVVGYGGPLGAGWQPALVYRTTFSREGQIGNWQGLIDASNGALLRFTDANAYDSLVKASVYTVTNCEDPLNCVPGTETETPVTMPYARLNFVGGSCSGDGCYTNSAGAFSYPPLAVAASTSLEGKYFQIIDACGAISAAGAAPGNIDLGTNDPDATGTNTDCRPADRESAPGTGPVSGGSGDTHAARATFYHLNLINQKSRSYLPDNDWLRGADGSAGPVPTSTNGPPACNAFWSGAGALVFLRQTPGLNCNNFGEVPDIFLHEFGHGLDSNDGSGNAPEGGTGEAMGDTFGLLQGQDSCMGEGGFLGGQAGYGSQSNLCSGVRELDYTRYCDDGTSDGCRATPIDPDAPHGSRSGDNPSLAVPDEGTPARWNHMIETAPPGISDGLSNFYDCGGPETTGCAGALNHGCHCESLIASQSNWDLARAFVEQKFGGNIYADPPGPAEVSGWQYMDRLWYLTRDLAGAGYSVSGPAPTGVTNGCSAVNWFPTYRFIDDDDGNLANGTPHADLIYQALDLHGMACGTPGDSTNQPTSCAAPVAAPTLSTCGTDAPVQLDWTASAGASRFRVLRNTLGCDFGFSPLADVDGNQQFFEDAEVAPGVPYYYSVQPVGESRSCYGQTSNCLVVTPSICGEVDAGTPTNLSLTTPADNRVDVSWDAATGAGGYKILRKRGGCASSAPFEPIGTVSAPTTSFADSIELQGTLTYAYAVAAADTSCAACTSAPSACVEIQATGPCGESPSFSGLELVSGAADASCSLALDWDAGSPVCGNSLTYDVYRSTDALFEPLPSNLLRAGVSATSFVDRAVVADTRYFYLVRAVDSVGNRESNLERRNGISGGEPSPADYEDDAGDGGTAKFYAAPDPGNSWSTRSSTTGNATRVYATTAGGPYPNTNCMALDSNEITLGANPQLEFRSRFTIEPAWDGGIVEVSTAGGGFSDWTKLDSVNYPSAMAGTTEVCAGNPGLSDGQLAFNGTSTGWQTFGGSLLSYANQTIKLRFLFGTDDATNDEGWFIDDILVSDALVPETCLSEVSGRAAGAPLLVGKEPGGTLTLIFEDLESSADVYNIYEGEIGTWYGHTPGTCHEAGSQAGVPTAGRRTLSGFAVSGNAAYFMVTASNTSAEGVIGFDGQGVERPLFGGACGPLP